MECWDTLGHGGTRWDTFEWILTEHTQIAVGGHTSGCRWRDGYVHPYSEDTERINPPSQSGDAGIVR